ncbi:MAG: glyoxylase-like metal-dependent hydrolase (beta-lactamase superfamily II) [Verrucomicrobiales bacterium]|jgi:glyoxylase-like metal-dependent hydrolase (beta-lactamase superfamily II)
MSQQTLEKQFPGLYAIGSILVRSYPLVNECEATLIDSGLLWEPRLVRKRLQQAGLSLDHLRTILLTHGHLDHTANLQWYRRHTKATILAHPLEKAHIDGTFPYPRPNWICDALERIGRKVLRYHPVTIAHELKRDMEIPVWGGLRVVALPGHTEGHCGFYFYFVNYLACTFSRYIRISAREPDGLRESQAFLRLSARLAG